MLYCTLKRKSLFHSIGVKPTGDTENCRATVSVWQVPQPPSSPVVRSHWQGEGHRGRQGWQQRRGAGAIHKNLCLGGPWLAQTCKRKGLISANNRLWFLLGCRQGHAVQPNKMVLKCHLGLQVPGMGKQHNGWLPPASTHPEDALPHTTELD